MPNLSSTLERELGNALGGNYAHGYPYDISEPSGELQWPQSTFIFDQMRRQDAQVAGVFRAVTLPIRQARWVVDPNGAKPEVVQLIADDLGLPILGEPTDKPKPRQRDRFSFDEHLRMALLSLAYGHMCVDQQTEALTRNGWKRGADLEPGDVLYTLNPETGLGEWQPLERVWRYEGSHVVRHFEGRSHSSITTLDHRWITRAHSSRKLRFRTTDKLTTDDRIIRAAPSSDLPLEPKWSDALVELVAWYWTEGQEHPSGGAFIWQSETVNSAKCARIRAALHALFGAPHESLWHGHGPPKCGWRETSRVGGVSRGRVACWYLDVAAAKQLRTIAPGKNVAPWFIADLTAAQLRLFVETSIDADGCRSSGRTCIVQKNGAQLDSFEMACSLLGIPWTRTDEGGWFMTRLGSQTEIRPVAAARRVDGRMTDTLETVDDGVWCPQVANHTWLARRRGTVWFTGNCFEQVYRIVEGPNGSQARLRKLAPRMPRTLLKINVAADGGLEGITQQGIVGQTPMIDIPVSRLAFYANEREGGNWQGLSIFRSAYKHWLLKDRLLRVGAMSVERNGMGVPVIESRPGATATEIAENNKLAQGYRAGEFSGGAIPNGTKLTLQGVQGGIVDPMPQISYHDKEIATNILAQFLELGHSAHGSRALGGSFIDFFTMALDAIGGGLASTLNEFVVEDLVDLNFGDSEPAPLVKVDPVDASTDITPEAIVALINAGAIEVDDDLESFLREKHNLPARNPAEPARTTLKAVPAPVAASVRAAKGKPWATATSRRDALYTKFKTRQKAALKNLTVDVASLIDAVVAAKPQVMAALDPLDVALTSAAVDAAKRALSSADASLLKSVTADAIREGQAEGSAGAQALLAQRDSVVLDFDLAFEEAMAALGDFDSLLAAAEPWVAAQLDALGSDIGNQLAKLVSQGATRAQMQAAVDSVLAEARGAWLFLDNVIASSLTDGALELYTSEGVSEVDFLSSGDDRVDEDCADAEAQNPWSIDAVPQPPLHLNCFPGFVKVSGPEAIAATSRWYSGQLVEVITADGRDLAVTPNHPVLTTEGWIAAGLLHEGHKLIGALARERGVGGHPDNGDVPAAIEDVAESLRRSDAMRTARVPVAAEDFDGDGAGSQVGVVPADGLLADRRDAALGEQGREVALGVGSVGTALLSRESGLDAVFLGVGLPSNRIVRGSGVEATLLRRAALGKQSVRRRAIAKLNSRLRKTLHDRATADTERAADAVGRFSCGVAAYDFVDAALVPSSSETGRLAGGPKRHASFAEQASEHLAPDARRRSDALDRLAAEITTYEVVDLRLVQFSGHVYNLETVDGWYCADGIVVHNCRCTVAVPST